MSNCSLPVEACKWAVASCNCDASHHGILFSFWRHKTYLDSCVLPAQTCSRWRSWQLCHNAICTSWHSKGRATYRTREACKLEGNGANPVRSGTAHKMKEFAKTNDYGGLPKLGVAFHAVYIMVLFHDNAVWFLCMWAHGGLQQVCLAAD